MAVRDALDVPSPSELVPLADAPSLAPRRPGGRRLSTGTLYRWALKGWRGHRLRTWLVGGRHHTTADAIREFIVACSESGRPDSATPRAVRPRVSATRTGSADADTVLDKGRI
jgi:hypothetical protein